MSTSQLPCGAVRRNDKITIERIAIGLLSKIKGGAHSRKITPEELLRLTECQSDRAENPA